MFSQTIEVGGGIEAGRRVAVGRIGWHIVTGIYDALGTVVAGRIAIFVDDQRDLVVTAGQHVAIERSGGCAGIILIAVALGHRNEAKLVTMAGAIGLDQFFALHGTDADIGTGGHAATAAQDKAGVADVVRGCRGIGNRDEPAHIGRRGGDRIQLGLDAAKHITSGDNVDLAHAGDIGIGADIDRLIRCQVGRGAGRAHRTNAAGVCDCLAADLVQAGIGRNVDPVAAAQFARVAHFHLAGEVAFDLGHGNGDRHRAIHGQGGVVVDPVDDGVGEQGKIAGNRAARTQTRYQGDMVAHRRGVGGRGQRGHMGRLPGNDATGSSGGSGLAAEFRLRLHVQALACLDVTAITDAGGSRAGGIIVDIRTGPANRGHKVRIGRAVVCRLVRGRQGERCQLVQLLPASHLRLGVGGGAGAG